VPLFQLRVMAWCTVQWSRRPSWRILLLAERHDVPCIRPGALRGWRRRNFPFGRRPYTDSRVQLTGGRRGHNSGRGSVLSPHAPTASRMALQCPGWRRDGGDGRTRPMVTEEMHPTGPTSRRGPGRARNRRLFPFRGFHRPFSRVRRVGRTGVGCTVSQS
jgi:hypothetical protein